MSDLERLLDTSNKLFLAGYREGYAVGYRKAMADAQALVREAFAPPEPSAVTPITKAAP